MKRIVAFILLLCMVMSLAACGKVEITMQEIYDASQTEAYDPYADTASNLTIYIKWVNT